MMSVSLVVASPTNENSSSVGPLTALADSFFCKLRFKSTDKHKLLVGYFSYTDANTILD
jgi:hypothetical protein